MKNRIKLFISIFIIIQFIFSIKSIAIESSTNPNYTWEELKDTIENSQENDIEIELKASSNPWVADSKITIKSGQNVTLIANNSITITRVIDFTDSFFENNGTLTIKTKSKDDYITLDGNKDYVEATGSLIKTNSGKINLNNIVLKNNSLNNSNGGAIYASDAEIEIENAILSENEAKFGGGIFIDDITSDSKLTNIQISNNKAITGSGGGIYAYGKLVISGENTLISGNIAQTYGGGLMVKTIGLLNGGEISNNQAITYAGGGIRVDGRFTYNSGTIKENTAGTTGGGIDFSSGILYGEGNEVFNNTATEAGNNLYPDLEKNVDWTKDENLKLREIDVSLLKSFVKGTDIVSRGTQGMTVTDKYIVFTLWKSNDDTTMIAIANKDTGEILNIVDGFEFKHANDMTYDSKNDEVYILTSSKKIAKFKINEQYQIIDLQYVDCNRYYSSIAYNKDADGFIGMSGRKMYVTNNKFEEQSMFETPTNLTTQGMGYYDGNIYFCCTESGVPNQYQTIYNNKERLSNLIYKYDLEGNLVETLYIPNTILYGEIESCAFEEDGTLVASYNITLNGKSTVSLYKSDITTPILDVHYNTTEITNKDVIVTINSNEEIQQVEGWTLSEDKKILTKIYTQNTNEELKVYDYGGNEKIVNIKIENIDKEKPTLDISYSTTKTTNKDVLVTINSNEELKNVSGWTLSEDKKTLTKTYTENKTENIEITDLAGNVSTAVIDIKNIDKENPEVEVKYSTTEKTLNDVIVTIGANEELQEIEGWQLSDDKKSLNKTYTKNDEETITIYDLAGNSTTETIKVENIDKEKPQYEVEYSTTLSTNEDVIITITANEEIQSIEGWKLSEDKKLLTKKYTENTEEEIIIKDIVGNSASKTIIKINNIDKIKPEINVSYSITELTNQDIIVTITANEEIKEIEGWNLSTDKKELKKEFTSNTEENITISDLAGNTISDTIKIGNIDKVTPKIEIKYSTTSATDKDVIVTITSDKIIRNVDGWTLSSDKKQLTKNFNENGEEEITIIDEAGNSVTTKIKVSNIDKTETKQVDMIATSNNDTTTAKMILPNTGEKSILIFVIIFMILSTIMYIKFKKYKDVK